MKGWKWWRGVFLEVDIGAFSVLAQDEWQDFDGVGWAEDDKSTRFTSVWWNAPYYIQKEQVK